MNSLYKNAYIRGILLSYAQLFFSSSAVFGAGLLAISFINPVGGLTGLICVIIINLMAALLGYDKGQINSGLYGFTGFLLGAGYSYFFVPTASGYIYLFVVLFTAVFLIATLQHYFFNTFKTGSFTIPFLISFYLLYAILLYSGAEMQLLGYDSDPFTLNTYLSIYFKSMGFILFQKDLIAGILVAVLVLFYSRVLFTLSIAAYTAAYFVGFFIHDNISEGIMLFAGFNSILTAFAVGGCLVIPSRSSLLMGFVGVIMASLLTVLLYELFANISLSVLVVPFNITAILLMSALYFRINGHHPRLLYFIPGSPEENLYYHLTRKSRFDKFKYYFPELPFFGEWSVSQGINGNITHKDAWANALDFVIKDKKNSQFENKGLEVTDYYCYEAPVTAPLDGRIVEVINTIPENVVGEANLQNNWGNTIIIDHYEGLFSALSHLKQNSAKVAPGDYVKKGDRIAACGNSGRSPYPHLHFQFQITPKLGERTYHYPLSHFLEKNEDKWILRNFDVPSENSVVSNLETDRMMTQAFGFALGDIIKVAGTIHGRKRSEEWTVQVTIYNELYLLSTSGDIVYIYNTGKVLYLSNYVGNKGSLLYYFYLTALQVPLCSKENLYWTDNFSPAHYPDSLKRVLSEFFIFLYNKVEAESDFMLQKPQPDTVEVCSEIILKSLLGNPTKKLYRTSLTINKHKGISEFAVYKRDTAIAEIQIEDYQRTSQ